MAAPSACRFTGGRVWTCDAVDSSIVFSRLQEQARTSAPLEEVGHGMCCIIGLSLPFLALRIKPAHAVTAEHSRIPLSRNGRHEDCLTRKVKRGDRTSKSTLMMTLKRAKTNGRQTARRTISTRSIFSFSSFQTVKNLTSPILEELPLFFFSLCATLSIRT